MSLGGPLAEVSVQAAAKVAVTRLMLTNFRSYGMLDLKSDGRHVVLLGPNGAGKTNVLEALSMFAPGKSLRGAKLSDLSRAAPGVGLPVHRPWAVSATLSFAGDDTQIGVGYLPGSEESGVTKRSVRVDGAPLATTAQLAERIRLIWLTPSMDRLFIDGVSERRRFLDRLIASFDPLHARRWAAFEIAMRERLGALRSGGDSRWLSALERTMAEAGVAVAASRATGVRELTQAMNSQLASSFPRADIGLSGTLEDLLCQQAAVEVEDQYADKLRLSRGVDLESGRTSHGPHLTDFVVRHREKNRDAHSCSTGEQKALLIRLTLGCAALPAPGAPDTPIVLLDEVTAHLDETRRRALFDEIDALNVQAWVTGTDASAFVALEGRAQFKRVADGQIRPC